MTVHFLLVSRSDKEVVMALNLRYLMANEQKEVSWMDEYLGPLLLLIIMHVK